MRSGEEKLEPVLNNNEPKWLIIEYKQAPCHRDPSKTVKQEIQDTEPLEIVPYFELKKQGLWQCQKCGAIIESHPEPPLECYGDQEGCNRHSTFKPITKTINPDLWKLPKWEDIPTDDIDMLSVYDDMLELIKKLLVFSEDIEYKILTLWIISTWKLERWDTVGYPIFIGIPNSGKSRALRIIYELGYRFLKASGIKQAVIPRLCHYYNVGVAIDEAHTKLNPRTETGAGLLEFIKDSYKRGSIYAVCDNNNQENVIVTRNFGYKAIAGEKSFNPALLSRGLIFWMDKAEPEIAKLSYIQEDIDKLRTRLLNYRFKLNDPPDLGNDFCLKGRTREIYESIIATGKHIGIKVDDITEYAKERDKREEEAIQSTVEYEILFLIKDYQEGKWVSDAPEGILLTEILAGLEWENDSQTIRKLGYILRNMGLATKRTRKGRGVFYNYQDNEKRLNKLYKRYRV